MTKRTKIVISSAIILFAVLAQFRWLDDIGMSHTQAGLQRALVTYGVSRGLNGVVSVVQGTEVAVEPVGVGMTFTPGQILDPVNDLIERFSGIVLVSGTAFGIQRILLEFVSSTFFCLLIAVTSALLLMSLWLIPKGTGGPQMVIWLKLFLFRSALVLLIIRFSIPITAIISETVYENFLKPSYQNSSQKLLFTTEKLNKIKTETQIVSDKINESKSFLESARDLYNSTANKLDVQKHIQDFKQAAESISEHAIELIVVFVIQTLLLPLLSVWVTLRAIKWVAFTSYGIQLQQSD